MLKMYSGDNFFICSNGVSPIALNPIAQDSMINDFYLQILCVEQPQKLLTRNMYIFEETVSNFTQYVKNMRKFSSIDVKISVNSRAQDSSAQVSMTNDFYSHTKDFPRNILYCVKCETVSSNMYISCVNCVFQLLGLFNA